MTQALNWRWIFFVNLPIAGLAAAATLWTIPHDKPVDPGQRLDYGGVATLSGGLIALLLALDFFELVGLEQRQGRADRRRRRGAALRLRLPAEPPPGQRAPAP